MVTEPEKRLNILIVEDDDMTRKLLVIEFKRRGHNVLEYADTAAAMNDLKREPKPIDAGIVDLMNMGYGGNIGDYLRKMKDYKNIAIFYYTALTKQQFNTKILEQPNTYYVHKEPGSIKQLTERVENLCST